MPKTPAQIYAERGQRIKERREFLVENPEVYQRDFVEIDLNYPASEIKTDIMAQVDHHWKDLETSDSRQGLVKRPQPRNRASSYTYKPMEVWRIIEEKRTTFNKPESTILSKLAKELCESEGWDKTYGKFEDDPDTDERVKARRNGIKAAYERDKKLYYGEVIFMGIS
jgi:hypothetical protein